ncbi:MAG: hypothetical protein JO040_02680 [Gemmatimonadetes bacterium]|nr:hypothetical protein [Gemmatimonadota bacterium]
MIRPDDGRAALGILLLGACAGVPPHPPAAPAPDPPAPTAEPAPVAVEPPAPAPEPPLAAAPWGQAPLPAASVPSVFLAQWRKAENRASCTPLAPLSAGSEKASARAAYFGGGWGVAYDLPGLRSAFGVAGTGVDAAGPSYSDWPYERRWADGSSAGYGPEGGTGPSQLAYLRIPGQGCLYNVWSRLGREHLESLLERLRFVTGSPTPASGPS